jgi:8-oxo-dGTP diphosphatase
MNSLHVAVAVISDDNGRILLARRAEGAHQGGLWEFPGGKVDPGETLAGALVRECREELGIEVQAHRPLIRIGHRYPDRSVLLDVHRVTAFAGEPAGMEGQPLAWAASAELHDYPMPAADVPIVNAIRLPDRYAITPPLVGDRFVFLDQLARTLERGARLVQFRVQASSDSRLKLAEAALALCHGAGARMLINQDAALARAIGADGVHLKSAQLHELQQRPADLAWVAASCHSAADLARLAVLDVDFAVLSPVSRTRSHPAAQPIGWAGFTELAALAQRPVYALGGLGVQDLQRAWQAGGQGVAAIGGLWGR